MQDESRFTVIEIGDFRRWLAEQTVLRGVDRLLIHHTWSPSYKDFNGSNHRKLQLGMWMYHTQDRHWDDIGQHFSTFPDGRVVTGRSLEKDSACTKGANIGAICIENVGNFDEASDVMHPEHRETILRASGAVCERWGIPVDAQHVLYHHWFDLNTGLRTDGEGVTKTCPGSAFFGGNKVEDAEREFLPEVALRRDRLRPDIGS